MFKCDECGHLFEEGEQARWDEDRGELWGGICREEMSGCPLCLSSYSEAIPCKICGKYYSEGEEDYCPDCQDEVEKKFEKMLDEHFTDAEIELLFKMYKL